MKKTYKELLKEYNLVAGILFVLFTVTLIFMLIYFFDNQKLQTENEQLREQIPVWTLKVECIDHELANYIYFEDNYTDYELYQEVIKRFDDLKEFENCEVISNE